MRFVFTSVATGDVVEKRNIKQEHYMQTTVEEQINKFIQSVWMNRGESKPQFAKNIMVLMLFDWQHGGNCSVHVLHIKCLNMALQSISFWTPLLSYVLTIMLHTCSVTILARVIDCELLPTQVSKRKKEKRKIAWAFICVWFVHLFVYLCDYRCISDCAAIVQHVVELVFIGFQSFTWLLFCSWDLGSSSSGLSAAT